MSGRVVLLLEGPQGAPIAVVCNSIKAADRIREASRYEALGTIPVVSMAEGMGR